MPRGKQAPKRAPAPDPQYNSELVTKFVNYLMLDGKKSVAQAIVYGAMERVADKKKGDALKLFEQVIETVKPQVEVRSRRVGGANYQVPMPVPGHRQNGLAFRWIITAVRSEKGRPTHHKLADELWAAARGEGKAMSTRDQTHRMAEANKAFAHFAR